jgi:hypothetical protein
MESTSNPDAWPIMTISRTVVIVLAGILCIAGCSRAPNQPKNAPSTRGEQAVVIHLDPANEPDGKLTPTGLADLEDKLTADLGAAYEAHQTPHASDQKT